MKKGLKRTTIRLESSIPVWEDRQAGDTSIDDSENQGTRPVAETGAGFHQRHVSLLVLHPWNVVRGHDLSEKVQSEERDFDIRLIAATNENLERAIAEGRFREDLFHRLNEFTIRVPMLSECPEDILPLARFLLGHLSEEHRIRVQGFDRLAEAALRRYPWPGNIRELRNALRRALLLAGGNWITATDLNLDLTLGQEETSGITEEEKEKQLLLQTLEQAGNNRARAARILDISRTTLYEKLRKYGII